MAKFQTSILLTCISMIMIRGFKIHEIPKTYLHPEMINQLTERTLTDVHLGILYQICSSAFTTEPLNNSSQCVDNINKTDSSLCTFNQELLKCMDPLIQNCLSKEKKDLLILFGQSDTSLTRHLCTTNISDGNMREIFNPCVKENLYKCLKETDDVLKNEIQTLSRSKVCSMAFTLRGCMRTQMELSCENINTVDTVMAIVEATVAPCFYIYEENKVH